MKKRRPAIAVVLLAALALDGCAMGGAARHDRHYEVTVEARAQDDARRLRRLTLAPPGGDPAAADARFREYVLYAAAILGARGYTIAPDLDQTELVVILEYGISDPQDLLWTRPAGPEQRYTLFARELRLIAYDWRALLRGERREVFRVTASSVGSGGSLDEAIPYLATAMQPYLGTHRKKPAQVRLPLDDERVLWLRDLIQRLQEEPPMPLAQLPGE